MKNDLIDLCEQSVQYVSFEQSVSLFLSAMRTLLEMMVATGDEDLALSRRRRPRISIEKEQLRFLIECDFNVLGAQGVQFRDVKERMESGAPILVQSQMLKQGYIPSVF